MDYEKKYKEALERVREALNDGTISSNTIAYLQDIFPELKDSEDERIRKEIIDFILDNETNEDDDINRWLSWLEKQGAQKSKWTEEDEIPQEKSEVKVAIADLETPQDPILIRLDRIYYLLLEIRNNNMLRQPYIETYPPYPYPIQPWYDTNKVNCDKASTETNTQDDVNE